MVLGGDGGSGDSDGGVDGGNDDSHSRDCCDDGYSVSYS